MSHQGRKNSVLGAWILLLILLAATFSEYYAFKKEQDYNAAVLNQKLNQLPRLHAEQRNILMAWKALLEDDLVLSGRLYAETLASENPDWIKNARFNLADIYIRQAIALETSDKPDARLPLIELAKENYRSILRSEPLHWPSRYNLARALQLLPDSDLQPQQEDDIMPERSPTAPVETSGFERLP